MGLDKRAQAFVEYMGVDLGGGDVRVSQKLLQHAQVGAIGQKVRGEGMTQPRAPSLVLPPACTPRAPAR